MGVCNNLDIQKTACFCIFNKIYHSGNIMAFQVGLESPAESFVYSKYLTKTASFVYFITLN